MIDTLIRDFGTPADHDECILTIYDFASSMGASRKEMLDLCMLNGLDRDIAHLDRRLAKLLSGWRRRDRRMLFADRWNIGPSDKP